MQTESTDAGEARQYGTMEGVFVPTLLTILGVILFLRTGWLVGNAGLLGAVGIILLAFLITGFTALSLASISTNITPEAGGAYALVARSFGVEAGGAVGIPLYLSQSLVIVLYVFGFRDGWLAIFPGHAPMAVDLLTVTALIAITLISTKVAFRIQYVILAIVAVALGTIVVAAVTEPWSQRPTLLGSFPGSIEDGFRGTDAWVVFAVFFPATTGIMAGLNLSGELRDARRSILRGTLPAVGVSMVIYLAVAVWLASVATPVELVSDYFVMVERSAWGPAVLAGLLAATFSSALACLLGAPRILQALANHRVTPAAPWLAHRNSRGEPRHALIVTIVIVVAAVLLRDLNAIAPPITLVFLLTYAAINVAVLAETLVDLPSYRPTFRVPWPIPLLGALGCVAAMFIIDTRITLLALLAVAAMLVWLGGRDLERPVTDIRGAMLSGISQWASRRAREMPRSGERTWAPRLLVPIRHHEDIERARRWLPILATDGGSVRLVVVTAEGIDSELHDAAQYLRAELEEAGLDVNTTTIEADESDRGPAVALIATHDEDDLREANVVVAGFPDRAANDATTRSLLRTAFEANVGVVLVPTQPPDFDHDDAPPIALWIRTQGPRWRLERHLPHSDLALLIAYQLTRAWSTPLELVTATPGTARVDAARDYLGEVAERARLPGPPELHVLEGTFSTSLAHAPSASLHVMALSTQVDFARLREVRDELDAPCLFVRDSGVENAFA